MFNFEAKEYKRISRRLEKLLKNGVHAHGKHLPRESGMKVYVKMFRWVEFDSIIALKSEPFDSEREAQHFADRFNDNFLEEAYCELEHGHWYVYSDWLIKSRYMSYCINSKGEYFEFANWS